LLAAADVPLSRDHPSGVVVPLDRPWPVPAGVDADDPDLWLFEGVENREWTSS
jgi:hypothetical protein